MSRSVEEVVISMILLSLFTRKTIFWVQHSERLFLHASLLLIIALPLFTNTALHHQAHCNYNPCHTHYCIAMSEWPLLFHPLKLLHSLHMWLSIVLDPIHSFPLSIFKCFVFHFLAVIWDKVGIVVY